ncbi:hypothetical protein EZV62_005511 [Acer yangbiense]|uniref:Uncharacterized protein n=1 Tax=Acer yangbiense TaxID=1000413 RepID=A0A5C7IQ39_9ROSI|nr:hypothetical protein EZV62_005511 [Acer yangbiense]
MTASRPLSNFHFIEEILRRRTEFTAERDLKNGSTLLHLACIRGDVEMVMALVGLDSQLCFVKDKMSMFPLQTAVIHGHGDVTRELIFTCPESLQMLTSQKETVFHLAAKNYQCDIAFEVLFEEAKKLNQKHLLHEQDDEGNTVLHIAGRKHTMLPSYKAPRNAHHALLLTVKALVALTGRKAG